MRRFTSALALVLVALATTACDPEAGALPPPGASPTSRSATSRPATSGYPSSMAALGDSITVAFGSCLAPVDCPRNSWSTGNGTRVNSHYKRIVKANPAMSGHARNLAKRNATSHDLPAQADAAVKAKVEYVTVLVGANDACHGGIDDMTSVAAFRANVDRALGTLARQLPGARVYVASIPDVYRVWQSAHTNKVAVRIWKAEGTCPALLANAGSTAPADVQRRKTFADRVDAYDQQLSAACRASGPRCRYDGGAVHRNTFTVDMLQVEDFFHPNTIGLNKLAEVTYPGTFTW